MEGSLSKLQASVRVGGKLVSHRALFSEDASELYIIQGSSVLTYSTSTCLLTSRFTTPGSVLITNAHVKSSSEFLVFTSAGHLLTIDLSSNRVTSTRIINMAVKGWATISNFTDFMYPSKAEDAFPHFLALGYPQDSALPVLYSVNTESERIENPLTKLCWSVLATPHSFAMSPDGKFVVAIQEDALYCKDMSVMEKCSWHSSGSRKFTCVAVHPTSEFVCATGDDSGRVLIWNNVLTQKSPAKTVFHWHTLPVIDLVFTPEGSHMMSGGGECTMVKWDTKDVTNKRTLPRMGLPIRHINCSENGELIAVSHADNCVQLVNPYNEITGVVRNFTQAYVPLEDEVQPERLSVFPSGVNVDPNNGCLVVNGRPGHLQCYDFKLDMQVYNMDVVNQNYVTAEREKQIPNAEVLYVGFSKNGVWMGTIEGRIVAAGKRDEATELKLKFWKMNKEKGVWVLSTCADYPHERHLKSFRFRPVPESEDELVAVTSGDLSFKVWGLAEITSVHGNVEHWFLEHTRNYKNIPAGPVSFSSDGSLLGASFGRSLTLWDMSDGSCSFRLSLCHSRLTEPINRVEFGQNVNSHLILCSSENNLFVWDAITSSLLWVAPVKVQSLAVDPLSNIVAAVSTDLHLYFFTLLNPEPISKHKQISKSPVVSSTFVSNIKVMKRLGLKSSLVCLNSSNEIIAMLPQGYLYKEKKNKAKRANKKAEKPMTPFAEMVAESVITEVEAQSGSSWDKTSDGAVGQRAYSILREIMDSSPHTMPSPNYYCTELLKAVSKPLTEKDRLNAIEKLMASQRKKPMSLSEASQSDEDMDVSILVENIHDCGNNVNNCYNNSNVIIDDCGVLAGKEINLDQVVQEETDWIQFVFKK